MQLALETSALSVSFGQARILDAISVSAACGKVTALLGPNGAGKTTFIRCCTNLISPDSGQISIFGQPPDSPQAKTAVGVMPQATGAWAAISARSLLTYLAGLYANPQPVGQLMALLGIDHYADVAYRRLSGGQQQCVNLAGALIGRPALVFLDEPTAGLDVRTRREVHDLIRMIRDAGVAVVLTTHDMHDAEQLSDDVHIIDQGRLTISGSVAELTAENSLEQVFLEHTGRQRC